MPKISTQHVSHTFGGGWSTDFGSTYYNTPQNGMLVLPWLNKADNVQFTLSGALEKFPGTIKFNSTPIIDLGTSGLVRGMVDYWRMGTSLTGTQKTVAAVGSGLFSVSSTSTTYLGSTSSAIQVPHFALFNDLLIHGQTGNLTPLSWDQTTLQNLAGTPPNFSFSCKHRGRHFGAGVPSLPSRLYYSATGNPEDWVGAGSGSIDIDPGDGDGIVGIWSWKNELWVFKGPNKLSIHRITGSSSSDFARTNFVSGIGAACQATIFPMGDDIGFWSPRGSCHSLKATDTYGDYTQAFINYPILNWCRNDDNMNGSSYWQCVTDPMGGYSVLLFNNQNVSIGQQSKCLIMDWRFDGERYPRFTPLLIDNFTSLMSGIDIFNTDQTQLYFGTLQGNIYLRRSPETATYEHKGVQVRSQVDTPYLTYGPQNETKTINGGLIGFESNHNSTVTVMWGGSRQPKQSTTVAQPGYVGLDTFVLDTDLLGDLGNAAAHLQELSGDYESIQYTFIEDTALSNGVSKGMTLHNFGVSLTPSGEVQENYT